MRKSCVQLTHNCPLAAGITTQINHSPAYKNNVPVHNRAVYTPTRVQTTVTYLYTSAQDFGLFNR